MRVATCLGVLLVVSLSDSAAQAWPCVPGQRVRITASQHFLEKAVFTCERLEPDTLVVGGRGTIPIPLASLEQLEVSVARHRRPWRGAGIGFLVGATLGAVAGAAYPCQDGPGRCDGRGALAFGAAFVLGSLGMVPGIVVGAFVKTDTWERVPLERFRVSTMPTGGQRLGFRISVAF